jgi:hypothetical protein
MLAEISEKTTTKLKKLAINDVGKNPKTAALADPLLRERGLKPSQQGSKVRINRKGAHRETGPETLIHGGAVHVHQRKMPMETLKRQRKAQRRILYPKHLRAKLKATKRAILAKKQTWYLTLLRKITKSRVPKKQKSPLEPLRT